MNERIEHDLVTLFNERAESTPPSPVPQELLGLSTRPRRRAGLVAVAAAAVVVAIAGAGTAVLVDSGSSGEDRPAGQSERSLAASEQTSATNGSSSPRMPYIRDGVLHHAAAAVPTTADQLRYEGGTLLATDNAYSQDSGEVSRSWILRGDELVPLPYLDNAVVELSLDGTQAVAMTYPDRTTTRLTLYDLAQGTATGSIDLAAAGSCCESGSVSLRGFDMAGRVFYDEDGARSFGWDPRATEPTPITGAPGVLAWAGPEGVLAAAGRYGSSPTRVLGEVSESGAFVGLREFTMPGTEPAAWSPSGAFVAYSGNAGPVVEPRDASTAAVRLDINPPDFSHFVGFESETDLLLVAREGNRNNMLRCATTGSCEVIYEIGASNALDNWVFPHL